MKRAFIMTADCHLTSELVPECTKCIFNIGDRVCTSRPLDLGHAAQIKTGECGTVDFIDAHTGGVEVLMDTYHRGLHAWHNHIWLEPFGTEDILSGIVCILFVIPLLLEVA